MATATAILGPAPSIASVDLKLKLADYLPQFYFVERDLARTSRSQLVWCVTTFGEFLKRQPRISDLTDATVNNFVAWMTDQPIQPETMRSKRRGLLTIWRAAYFTGLAPFGPGRIREIKRQMRIPEAWTPEQIARLIEVAQAIKGTLGSGVRRRWFWEAFIRTGFDTGLRFGDLLRLRRSDIRSDGVIILIQHKTGRPVTTQVYPETLTAIDSTFPPPRERVFADALSRGHIIRNFPTLLEAAGLQGSIKYLRRSCASFAELMQPGTAARRLGHSTPELAQRYYIDPWISSRRQELPENPLPGHTPIGAGATALHTEWQAKASIDADDIASMLRRLDVTQTRVSILLGRSPTWLNALLKGREKLSAQHQADLREFVRQQAEKGAI